MKKILVPTDFSECAANATKVAMEIAAKFNSEVYLYHFYSFNKRADYDWNYPADEQPYIKRLEKKMAFAKKKALKESPEVSIQTIVEESNVFALFQETVTDYDISLIVMGSKGASGLQKAIFGSVAATALELAKVPLLVIPPNYSFTDLDHIVLTTDLNEVSPNTILPLQNLVNQFKSKVTILNVNSSSAKITNRKIDNYLSGAEVTYRQEPMTKSVNESINEFIGKNKCDLLCMVRREKGFFESIFKESVTKNQVYNSQTPILVLPENSTTG